MHSGSALIWCNGKKMNVYVTVTEIVEFLQFAAKGAPTQAGFMTDFF